MADEVVIYEVYIRSESWRQKRLQVLRRARGICERCNEWPVVNVHHITYERLGDERLEDLLGVCICCHDLLHQERQS